MTKFDKVVLYGAGSVLSISLAILYYLRKTDPNHYVVNTEAPVDIDKLKKDIERIISKHHAITVNQMRRDRGLPEVFGTTYS